MAYNVILTEKEVKELGERRYFSQRRGRLIASVAAISLLGALIVIFGTLEIASQAAKYIGLGMWAVITGTWYYVVLIKRATSAGRHLLDHQETDQEQRG